MSESMRGKLSKCDCRGTDIVESDEINDEITSGEAVSTVDGFARWARDGSDFLRRDNSDDWAAGAGVVWERSMATNGNGTEARGQLGDRQCNERK